MISRRGLLGTMLASPLAGWHHRARASSPTSMRVYYTDDTTDIATNASPFHKRDDDITERDIVASIDEAADAGIDVYVNQPGSCWIPWWKSAVYPPEAHYAWYAKTYDVKLTGLEKFVGSGGDVIGTALDHCRARKLPMLVSMRLNDIHGIALSGVPPEIAKARLNDASIAEWQRRLPITMSRVHMEHPEWRIVPGSSKTEDMLWNWQVPDAVAHKQALCEEVVRRYDVDGIELDFMRYPRFFPDAAPLSERAAIMTGFITAIRAALDAGRKQRELALRVPAKLAGLAPLGLDPARLRAIGVDRLNLSSNSFTSQDADLASYRASFPRQLLSLELAQAKHFLMHQAPRHPDDEMVVLAKPADDITTAYLAQRRGIDTLSLFNFVYYRQKAQSVAGYDHSHEPPFGVIRTLREPGRASLPVQSWFLGTVFFNGLPGAQMPGRIAPGRPLTLRLDIVPPAAGWAERGTLRMVAREPPDHPSRGRFEPRLNGAALEPADPEVAGFEEDPGLPFTAWAVPRTALRDGWNEVEIRMAGPPGPTEIALLEILIASAKN